MHPTPSPLPPSCLPIHPLIYRVHAHPLPCHLHTLTCLPLLFACYIQQFTRTDPKEVLQYVYCLCLTTDQGEGVGKEQIETAWDLCRKVVVSAEAGGSWEELVGGFRPDGIKYVSLVLWYYSVCSCNSCLVAS